VFSVHFGVTTFNINILFCSISKQTMRAWGYKS